MKKSTKSTKTDDRANLETLETLLTMYVATPEELRAARDAYEMRLYGRVVSRAVQS